MYNFLKLIKKKNMTYKKKKSEIFYLKKKFVIKI